MNTTGGGEATAKIKEDDDSGVARLNFRVRCETLGYGEAVFLYRDESKARPISLYTTQAMYPWYSTKHALVVKLPSHENKKSFFKYYYGVFRGGVFHRWEQASDGPAELNLNNSNSNIHIHTGQQQQQQQQSQQMPHEVPLRLLMGGELYTVNDVLGVTGNAPDIDHIRLLHKSTITEAASLHSRCSLGGSRTNLSSHGSLTSMQSGSRIASSSKLKTDGTKTKKVGFAPRLPSYHNDKQQQQQQQQNNGSNTFHTSKKQPVQLNSTDGLVVASAFLPVHLHRSNDGEWSADWDYEALLSMQTHLRVTRVGTVKWRGWHGNYGSSSDANSPEAGVPKEERHKVEACLRPFNCIPVWVDPVLFGEMYNGFCKGVLWPILHNITSVYSTNTEKARQGADTTADSYETPFASSNYTNNNPTLSDISSQFNDYEMDDVAMGTIHGDAGKEASLWSAYTAVNRQFADTIVQCFNEGDLVWIHGFHLVILPSYLTRKIPMAKVGIFLHTPFPSSEIFRTLWCREDLLRGMLNADQVGFHLFEYARHFLTCARRLLGLNYGMIPDGTGGHNLAIEMNGRHVAVTSIHAGIEPPVLHQVLNHPSTIEKANSIRNQFHNKVIFCAIDRMESLKGIPLKMLGLERFLHRCPQWIGKIVLIQVGISAFERGDDYIRTKKEILSMVAEINALWPGTVQFQECAESEMRLPQRMALMRAADVFMVTPIRDGLNLLPLEYTIAHQDAMGSKPDGRSRGLCVLSEFSSCTRVMRGALHVNPWKVSEIANAFHQALNMTQDERMRRLSCASEFVTRVTTQRWALAVLLDLKGVPKNVDVGKYSGAGLGLGFRLLGMDTGFNSLDVGAVAKSYKKARCRLLLFDYGGTILSNDNLDSLSRFQMVTKSRAPTIPTKEMIQILKDLCSDKRNLVFVVSGKERHSLTKTLSEIPNLGLAAEHGMFVSWPTSKPTRSRKWETIVPDQDNSWRSIAITVMEVYTSRTHGSYIEETEMKVLWQYRDADPEFGSLQAKELEDHLSNVLRSFNVDILHGGVEEGGYVEVRPKGVNKGVVSMHIINHIHTITTWNHIDFILALGDDHCDEPMLSIVRQIGRRFIDTRRARNNESPLPPMPSTVTLVDVSACDEHISPNLDVFTCTIGKKPSAAANYLNDVDDVHECLGTLVKVATRDHKFYSALDLRSLDSNHSAPQFNAFTKNNFLLPPLNNSNNNNSGGMGMSRSMSMGALHHSTDLPPREKTKISQSLTEFMGTIEDEDDEDAFFF